MKQFHKAVIVAVLTLLLPMQASAVSMGSIQLGLDPEGVPAQGIGVVLHKVGNPVTGGYLLAENFGGGFVAEADVLTPELVQWLHQKAEGGTLHYTDAQGSVVFSDLTEGLYLLQCLPDGKETTLIEPFLVMLPWDGEVWQIQLWPLRDLRQESPNTSDPGTLLWGYAGMVCSAAALVFLRKKA